MKTQIQAAWFVKAAAGKRPRGRTVHQYGQITSNPKIKILGLIIVSCLTVCLSGCGNGTVECSSQKVQSLALSQVRTQVENNPFITSLYLVEQSKFELKDIRTVDRSGNGARCAADLSSSFVARPEAIEAKLRESGTISNPINYVIQLSDEGRVYVTINPK